MFQLKMTEIFQQKKQAQHPSRSQQAASGARRVMSASCEVTQGVGDTWATCPTLLGLGAEGQGFVVEVDFYFTLSFLVVEMEDCRHRFCSAELYLPRLEVFT